MKSTILFRAAIVALLVFIATGFAAAPARAETDTPTPGPSVTPTFVPTATVGGPYVYVPEKVNVRTGPATYFDQVGVLVAGQMAPALGRTEVGEWILVEYPGAPGSQAWIYAALVTVRDAELMDLAVVVPPPTPTLSISTTLIYDTESGGPATAAATRLPTFTPAPPIVIPTFAPEAAGPARVPPIYYIGGLLALSLVFAIIAVMQQRG
ncbi:MAG: hypothetical protein RL635_860 [Chloroflexota bacterium]